MTRSYTERKRLFDRVQESGDENLPLMPLVSSAICWLARRAAWPTSGRPIMEHYTLWNVERTILAEPAPEPQR